MTDNRESLLEIAVKIVEKNGGPLTIDAIANEVFRINEKVLTEEALTQFSIDFMLSGIFICCGETKNHERVWDLKSRQSVTLLDKEANLPENVETYFEEDIKRAELNDENYDEESVDKSIEDSSDDDDEKEETDDIAEALGLIYDKESEEEATNNQDDDSDDEEETDEDYDSDDLEDIVEGEIIKEE